MARAAEFHTPFGKFHLERFPRRSREGLLPWCSADELLLEAVAADDGDPASSLVINDEHGALALPLAPAASWTDSFIAAEASHYNALQNGREPTAIIWSTDTVFPRVSQVVMRVPKQLPYFDYQLQCLARTMPEGTDLLAAGMDKHLSPRTAELIEARIGPTERHRGRKKARLFSARLRAGSSDPGINTSGYDCPQAGGQLVAMANVFSADHLDIGSRFLLDSVLPRVKPVRRVIDLACGNGVLGLAAFHQGLAEEVLFCDESAMALASARNNAERLFPASVAAFGFYHGDGLREVELCADLILCNPPFHLGHTVDEFAGRRLIAQCADRLAPGGQLLLVANAHLKYGSMLRKSFTSVGQHSRNAKFVIWQASQS